MMTDADTEARELCGCYGCSGDVNSVVMCRAKAIAAALRARETQTVEALRGLPSYSFDMKRTVTLTFKTGEKAAAFMDYLRALDVQAALAPLTPTVCSRCGHGRSWHDDDAATRIGCWVGCNTPDACLCDGFVGAPLTPGGERQGEIP